VIRFLADSQKKGVLLSWDVVGLALSRVDETAAEDAVRNGFFEEQEIYLPCWHLCYLLDNVQLQMLVLSGHLKNKVMKVLTLELLAVGEHLQKTYKCKREREREEGRGSC